MNSPDAQRPHPPQHGAILVKVGGSIQDNPAQMKAIAADIAELARRGHGVIVVHGGGKAISAAMTAAGLQARFVLGQRYTDEATLSIVERVLCGEVNAQLAGDITHGGARAEPMTTLNRPVLYARRAGATDKEGAHHDLGLVGRVTRVDTDPLAQSIAGGAVPVIAPVALDEATPPPHAKLNVNADLVAGQVAQWEGVDTFILVSDTAGVRVDGTNYAATLTVAQCEDLKARAVIDGGMIPKIDACLMALAKNPFRRVCITDGRATHGLLSAAVGDDFPGTRIVR
ncbi:MAG: acetylglutamate kinase [Phycisphaerales bacterium]|nr:acetylglutamate kinase [Phycisphaerales bacterium]